MSARKTIIRIEKTRSYSVISNECFRDPNLTARAKGIFAYIMTLPDDWKLYKRELCGHFKEGRDAINSAFAELEQFGYIFKTPTKDSETQQFTGWEYTIYEKPQCFPELLETRNSAFPVVGNPVTTNNELKEGTDRRNVEKATPSTSQRSTGSKSNRKAALSPSGAPWVGVSYKGKKLPDIGSYEDLACIQDPILAAMAVTKETGVMGYGHWIMILNQACADGLPLDMAIRLFRSALEKAFGEWRVGESRNVGACLNRELDFVFGRSAA